MKTRVFRFVFILIFGFGSVSAADTEKLTCVVVHGATAGGWEWKKTGKFLSDDGHEVYRATHSRQANA
jgi:hypothetical protein